MSERTIPLPKVNAARSERRSFVGGSDARIIMGSDEVALVRLWQEKRGEAEPEDLSGTSLSSLGPSPRTLTGGGTRPIPAKCNRHPAPNQASGGPVDGGDPRRAGRGQRRGL